MSNFERHSVQCVLTNGNRRTTAWLPEQFATPGRAVRLKDGGAWHDGWRVASTGVRLPDAYLRERSPDYKQTRRASDV